MTPIPDDHLAARDLQRQFEELGLRRSRAKRRARWQWRQLMLALVATIGVLGAGGTAIKVSARESDDGKGDRDVHQVIPPAIGGAVVSAAGGGAAVVLRRSGATGAPPVVPCAPVVRRATARPSSRGCTGSTSVRRRAPQRSSASHGGRVSRPPTPRCCS